MELLAGLLISENTNVAGIDQRLPEKGVRLGLWHAAKVLRR